MGEYARYKGEEIKIGTCEDMLYLRADQAHLVTPLPGNVDPVKHANEIRFRFPFPDEDNVEPGDFRDHDRRVRIDGPLVREVLNMIDPKDHSFVQFIANQHGYNVCLPCPEVHAKEGGFTASEGVLSLTDGTDHAYRVNRNGFRGALFVKQQRYHAGMLVTIVECACGAAWRLPDMASAEPVIVSLRSMADEYERQQERGGTPHPDTFYSVIADRIAAGYQVAVPA